MQKCQLGEVKYEKYLTLSKSDNIWQQGLFSKILTHGIFSLLLQEMPGQTMTSQMKTLKTATDSVSKLDYMNM